MRKRIYRAVETWTSSCSDLVQQCILLSRAAEFFCCSTPWYENRMQQLGWAEVAPHQCVLLLTSHSHQQLNISNVLPTGRHSDHFLVSFDESNHALGWQKITLIKIFHLKDEQNNPSKPTFNLLPPFFFQEETSCKISQKRGKKLADQRPTIWFARKKLFAECPPLLKLDLSSGQHLQVLLTCASQLYTGKVRFPWLHYICFVFFWPRFPTMGVELWLSKAERTDLVLRGWKRWTAWSGNRPGRRSRRSRNPGRSSFHRPSQIAAGKNTTH